MKSFSPAGWMVRGFFGADFPSFGNPDGNPSGDGAWAAGGGNSSAPVADAVYFAPPGLEFLQGGGGQGSIVNGNLPGVGVLSAWYYAQSRPNPPGGFPSITFVITANAGVTLTQTSLIALRWISPYTGHTITVTGPEATSFGFGSQSAQWQWNLTAAESMSDVLNHTVPLYLQLQL